MNTHFMIQDTLAQITFYIYEWIDLLWIPLVLLVVHKRHWVFAVGFVLACALMLRLQTDFMISMGYETGIVPWLQSGVFDRGIIVYSIFTSFYLLLSAFSPGSFASVFLGATISIFMAAMMVSSIVMIL